MLFNIVAGHSEKSQGASGLLNEVTEDRKIKDALISVLKANGQTVVDCTSNAATANKVLSEQVASCNAHDGIDVHIHLNAGGGKGVEVLVYSTTSKSNPYAKRVCDNIASIGFKNRGVKTNSGLYVLKKSNNPALLIEVCFVDSSEDYATYKSVGVQKIAEEIAKGLMNKSSLASTTNTTPTASSTALKKGSKGEAVKTLQRNLNTVINAGLDIDGSFGTKTENAVKDFQRKYGLSVDGSFGPKSQAKMAEVLASMSSSQKYIVNTRSLRVRTGPGTNYDIIKGVSQGDVLTITETRNNWGHISGSGWVSLAYCKKA